MRNPLRNPVWLVVLVCLSVLAGCAASPSEDGPTLSVEEYNQLREESKRGLAEMFGIEDPPDVEIVRYADAYEITQLMDDCLTASGFAANGDGSYQTPAGQESAFNLAVYVCRLQYPTPIEYAGEWGKTQIRNQYRWTVEYLVPCLESEGFHISGIPSEDTFVATWNEDPFSPFSQVPALGGNHNKRWQELSQKCPQIAPGAVLWGDETIAEWSAKTQR